ncbi:uncharacterized protein LOC131229350 [Magnolia sinica]|uniref:uncharacterized protein LOC131229350 n=1 Tax=Magnolia sinica TaxID=86752 RepID=UPI002658DD9A|nr:uncharacterized protein LOC131229350 [Magnolia sinica]
MRRRRKKEKTVLCFSSNIPFKPNKIIPKIPQLPKFKISTEASSRAIAQHSRPERLHLSEYFILKNPKKRKPHLGSLQKTAAMVSDEQHQQQMMDGWDEEAEALSLSDLPILGSENCERSESNRVSEPVDFEFGSWAEDPLMCAADDVFFQGQILPLRPSVSSETGLLSGYFRPDSQKSSRCGSRSDSMDRSSWGFSSSGSSGSSSSRRCYSHSSGSNYNFYTHPSPRPQMGGGHLRRNACRSGRRSSSWGLFRLGLVKTPEIELEDLKKRSNGSSCNYSSRKKGKDGIKEKKDGEGVQKFLWGGGLNCKCSAAAVETVSSRIVIVKGKKERGEGYNGKQEISRRRTFEWLKELSIAETPVV